MRKDYEKLFTNLELKEPPAGLFDRIVLTIKREQELRQTRKTLFSFLFLLIVSASAMPISAIMLAAQIENSGILYFISTMISDMGHSLALWQDFSLAILESLPITGMLGVAISLGIFAFTLRLFLCRKKLLIKYLIQNLKPSFIKIKN
ncbi:MAG: hypothetical protein AAB525_04040 [Patescibacteria group bacterium]